MSSTKISCKGYNCLYYKPGVTVKQLMLFLCLLVVFTKSTELIAGNRDHEEKGVLAGVLFENADFINPVDIGIIIIFGYCLIRGFFRGFIKELFSLIAVFGG